jgi:hypothetical protein
MTRALSLAAVAGFCLTASGVAAQPSDTPRSPAASLSATGVNTATAAEPSDHTVSQRLRTTILINGAGRTLIVLGRGDNKR